MQPPLRHRNGIPFFHDKTESDFKEDVYERYDEMVTKQTALHLADDLWNGYPMQNTLDFITGHIGLPGAGNVVELGCSVGRLIGTIAEAHPATNCWAIDYSYQLLKRTKEYWIDGRTIHLDASIKGARKILLQGKVLKNLRLGLAKAEALPFDSESQDIVLSSFLFDRLNDPGMGLEEMARILRPGGQMIMISPLNYTKSKHWEAYYPTEKIKTHLIDVGFCISTWEENHMIIEPLDIHGNVVLWKCLAVVCGK